MVTEENGASFIRRIGDSGGGQYVVRMRRASELLLEALLDHTVTERLGSKAARIFRWGLLGCYLKSGLKIWAR